MSGRFGRRKRRQAREQIEQLELQARGLLERDRQSRKRAESTQDKYDHLLQQIRLWDHDVRNKLSRFSALLFETAGFRGSKDEPRKLEATPPMKGPLDFDLAVSDTIVAYIERIHHLRIELSRIDPIRLIRYLRLRVEETDHSVHYAISGSMLYDNRLTERDVEIIAHDVAEHLVRELNKPKRRLQ